MCILSRAIARIEGRNPEKDDKKNQEKDPVAMCQMGIRYCRMGDYETGLQYFTKAAELGDAGAHYELSVMYREGEGVEKDKKNYHSEQAAIGGHPAARHDLGCYEWNNGSFEIAKKHFIIAANLGYDTSLKQLRLLYVDGHASKEDYFNALRAYQAAVEAMKSAERKKAEEAVKSGKVKTF